jgi:protoporphyrin/coproporphyrin ferrochelatase
MSQNSSNLVRRTGVLLVNVGTPDSPAVGDVRRYLREFLTDPRVLTMSAIGRWLLVHLIIAPLRGPKSARAYQTIWTKKGSPLLENGKNLAVALQENLGPSYVVRLAMRYGNPAMGSVVSELLDHHQVERLVMVPLYPQYSSSATGTSIEKLNNLMATRAVIPAVRVVGDFFDDAGFISSLATIAERTLAPFKADHVLMSYHGLPENHVKATTANYCFSDVNCCAQVTNKNRFCYRAQCFETSRLLAAALGLSEKQYTVAFQSRLGRTPWIQPFTDKILADLYQRGVRRLAVTVPSFVSDCLETIEEIGDRAREDWMALGGEAFTLIPCTNTDPRWVDALGRLVRGQH